MNSAEECVLASNLPVAMSSLCSALKRSTQALKEVTSSSLLIASFGVIEPRAV